MDFGTLGRTRTANPLIRSQILYPLSYEGTLRVYSDAFLRSLSAENKSMRTRQSYGEAIDLLTAFLRTHGMPTAPEAISRTPTEKHAPKWMHPTQQAELEAFEREQAGALRAAR